MIKSTAPGITAVGIVDQHCSAIRRAPNGNIVRTPSEGNSSNQPLAGDYTVTLSDTTRCGKWRKKWTRRNSNDDEHMLDSYSGETARRLGQTQKRFDDSAAGGQKGQLLKRSILLGPGTLVVSAFAPVVVHVGVSSRYHRLGARSCLADHYALLSSPELVVWCTRLMADTVFSQTTMKQGQTSLPMSLAAWWARRLDRGGWWCPRRLSRRASPACSPRRPLSGAGERRGGPVHAARGCSCGPCTRAHQQRWR